MSGGAGIFCDRACILGEGPAAHPGLGRLYWLDILGRHLIERPFSGGRTTVHDLPVMASMVARVDDHTLLLGAEDGLYLREIATGRLRLLTPLEADRPETRSNDGRVHPSGALWLGTMGRKAETGYGAIHWFFRGELRKLFSGLTIPNAIAFSADGTSAIFADSEAGTIWRVATDPQTGLPVGDRQVFVRIPASEGAPDGAVIDQEGLVWNARWGGASLDAYAPDGTRVRSIALPARQVTCPAFIGPDADTLVVTSATEGLPPERTDDPFAGQTFTVPGKVKGRFEPAVRVA
ncbi:SMP-30/gluconolactonase/LRE family protein [Methylobacterium nonmethylotrophicum]|uniref:SMP-30/gluconolactonase/LRE family protein n=1 Tax=Methylobacterium nonmethylotrophicum TaxID=1141884 RepID=A0A4Z0NSB7_9HYPH|nr:SMP-30/gluconolactonase/LRE family protein [Methylobacterium nonmethylotrophicum]TGE00162.1 SMP-30/gluconolactonase/LRE family protein [Methylobacterium nonmethylotrophicum]